MASQQTTVVRHVDSWNREPSAMSALFGVVLPYRPPKSPIAAYFWRWRVFLETTSGATVIDPWEKVITFIVFYLLLFLVITGVVKLMPQQLALFHRRSLYYFWGHESEEGHAVQKLVSGWLSHNSSGGL
ncbi:hypothetical protein C8Q75DRAFT_803738 [Abortiporus biennis]|nr:hypothetical protein C8Q75DRAFT_803738 [Abortiporus biennis]